MESFYYREAEDAVYLFYKEAFHRARPFLNETGADVIVSMKSRGLTKV